MWQAILEDGTYQNIPSRRAVGRTEREALERLRKSLENFDVRRFPIMEEFVQAFSVKVRRFGSGGIWV